MLQSTSVINEGGVEVDMIEDPRDWMIALTIDNRVAICRAKSKRGLPIWDMISLNELGAMFTVGNLADMAWGSEGRPVDYSQRR